MPEIAHINDVVVHGSVVTGNVTSGSDTVFADGRPVARIGDKMFCRVKDHGPGVIVGGAQTVFADGRPVAFTGSRCTCGATVRSVSTVLVEDGGAADETDPQP